MPAPVTSARPPGGLADVDPRVVVLVLGLVVKAVVLVSAVHGWWPAGLIAAPATVPLATLALAPGHLLHGRRRTTYLLVVAALLSTLLLVDLVYARAFGSILSITMLAPGASYEGLGSSVWALLKPTDPLFYVDILLIGVLAAWPRWRRFTQAHARGARRRLPRSLIVAAACLLLFAGQILTLSSDPRQRLSWLSPLGLHVYEAYGELVDTNRALEPEERARVGAWFEEAAQWYEPAPEHADLFGALAGRDVYLIQVESMEQMVLGLEVEGQEITPTINGLLDHSLHFTDVVQQTRDGNTSDAELIFTAGVYPLDRGSAFLRFPDNDGYTTLPQLLAERGYATIAMHGDGPTFWNRDKVYPRLGWERFVAEGDFADRPELGMGIADSAMYDQAVLEQERSADRPVLMHLVTLTSHTPFELPARLQELTLSEDDMSAHYLQSMRYVDTTFAAFYENLGERGLLEESVFVLVGDHEGVHKYALGDVWLPENHARLPFIVHAPGSGVTGAVSTPGGQVDVLPTLAFLLGIPAEEYADSVMGRNLLGTGSGSGISSEGVLSEGVSSLGDGADLLESAYEVADLAITGDWFVTTP